MKKQVVGTGCIWLRSNKHYLIRVMPVSMQSIRQFNPGNEPDWLVTCTRFPSPHVVGMNHDVRRIFRSIRSCCCCWCCNSCNMAWRNEWERLEMQKLSIVAQALTARWSPGEIDCNYSEVLLCRSNRFDFSFNNTPYGVHPEACPWVKDMLKHKYSHNRSGQIWFDINPCLSCLAKYNDANYALMHNALWLWSFLGMVFRGWMWTKLRTARCGFITPLLDHEMSVLSSALPRINTPYTQNGHQAWSLVLLACRDLLCQERPCSNYTPYRVQSTIYIPVIGRASCDT